VRHAAAARGPSTCNSGGERARTVSGVKRQRERKAGRYGAVRQFANCGQSEFGAEGSNSRRRNGGQSRYGRRHTPSSVAYVLASSGRVRTFRANRTGRARVRAGPPHRAGRGRTRPPG
jgi:hypothetical protein